MYMTFVIEKFLIKRKEVKDKEGNVKGVVFIPNKKIEKKG